MNCYLIVLLDSLKFLCTWFHNSHIGHLCTQQVVQLMTTNCKLAVPLLIQHRNFITPFEVVSQILAAKNNCDSRYFLHMYLHSLFEANPHAGKEFHDMQVNKKKLRDIYWLVRNSLRLVYKAMVNFVPNFI